MSHSSPLATVPPELVSKVQGSGIGILSRWTPQQVILSHEVSVALPALGRKLIDRKGYWMVSVALWTEFCSGIV
jgi:hypothetical protein